MADNRLTDLGVKLLWENSNVVSLDISNNPVSTNTFCGNTRIGGLYLRADNSPLDDQALAKMIGAGILTGVSLGRTNVTPFGLEMLMKAGLSVCLCSNSFTEEELASITPRIGAASFLRVDNLAVTGEFLKYWPLLPRAVQFSGTRLSDEQILAWAELDWRPEFLSLSGEKITDACLPGIQKLQPSVVRLSNTDVTSIGLCKYGLSGARLHIESPKITLREITSMNNHWGAVFWSLSTDD